ncbi:MoaD/ThiS family protein [Rhodobacteraceae bacterium NNCM2]|nr:MoaD/ThiS family protein [Coraliihabitans acroporae]
MAETVTVELFGSLRRHAGGADRVSVEAATIRDVLDRLGEQFPGLAPRLERGVSVSIDGKIYTEALFQPVSAKNEVVLLPRIAGG